MPVAIKRAYEDPLPDDGYRVLVDRLWPRGVSKARAKLDAWMREIAPSHELRRWFHADPSRWDEFRERYLAELAGAEDALRPLARRAGEGRVTLVTGAKYGRNHAVVLKERLEQLVSEKHIGSQLGEGDRNTFIEPL